MINKIISYIKKFSLNWYFDIIYIFLGMIFFSDIINKIVYLLYPSYNLRSFSVLFFLFTCIFFVKKHEKIKWIMKSTDHIFYILFTIAIIISMYWFVFNIWGLVKYCTFFIIIVYLTFKKYWLNIDTKPFTTFVINQDFLNLLIFNSSLIILLLFYFLRNIKTEGNILLVYLSSILIYTCIAYLLKKNVLK